MGDVWLLRAVFDGRDDDVGYFEGVLKLTGRYFLGTGLLLLKSIHELSWIIESWWPESGDYGIDFEQILPEFDTFNQLNYEVGQCAEGSLE